MPRWTEYFDAEGALARQLERQADRACTQRRERRMWLCAMGVAIAALVVVVAVAMHTYSR